MESVHARPRQPEQDAARREPIEEPDYAAVGGRLISITEALDTDFKDAFELAFRLYAADSASDSPNQAPRECWPSAWEFRNIVKYPVVRSR
jgi:hypothetical protein